jgi:transposase
MDKVYIGMDVHKKYTVAVAMTEQGQVLGKEKIEHGASIRQAAWKAYLGQFEGDVHVALEATDLSYPICEAIEPYSETVTMAHPLKTRLIAEQRVKTDVIDGRTLAHLLRTDFLPKAYIPPREIRDQRELLRSRVALVHAQTNIKNRLHGVLRRCGEFFEGTDLFGKGGREYLSQLALPEPYRSEIQQLLRILESIQGEIKEVSQSIQEDVAMVPEAMRLTQIPGIGSYLAALIYWEIGDIERFASPSKLVGYCGLGPRVYSSGGRTFHGPITRQGNRYLRWALVNAAQHYYHGRRGPLGEFFHRVAKKHGTKAARVALARKLATIIWHVLRKKEAFNEARIGVDQGGRAVQRFG